METSKPNVVSGKGPDGFVAWDMEPSQPAVQAQSAASHYFGGTLLIVLALGLLVLPFFVSVTGELYWTVIGLSAFMGLFGLVLIAIAPSTCYSSSVGAPVMPDRNRDPHRLY